MSGTTTPRATEIQTGNALTLLLMSSIKITVIIIVVVNKDSDQKQSPFEKGLQHGQL